MAKAKKQEQLSGDQSQSQSNDNLKNEFDALKAKKIQPQTREVILRYHCSGRWFKRTVPYKSHLKTGDTVGDSREPGDKYCKAPEGYSEW